jgi:hypothetical protein
MGETKQPVGRLRRWLEKRRESQRRGAEVAQRAKAARKRDMDRAGRHGGPGTGDPGPFGGI